MSNGWITGSLTVTILALIAAMLALAWPPRLLLRRKPRRGGYVANRWKDPR